jgi:hypothetical protein
VSYTTAEINSSYLPNIFKRGIFGKEKEFIIGKKKLILNAVYMNFRFHLLKIL